MVNPSEKVFENVFNDFTHNMARLLKKTEQIGQIYNKT